MAAGGISAHVQPKQSSSTCVSTMAHVQDGWGAQDPWGGDNDLVVQDGWGAQDCWGNSEPQHRPRGLSNETQHHPRGLFEDVYYYIHHDGRESDAFNKLERVLDVSLDRLTCSAEG
jgi:hypothetical protein